jgi:hypothetical protein
MIWKRRRLNRDTELDSRLRAYRTEPREGFVRALSAQVKQPLPARRTRSRLAFAGAVSVFILGTIASLGGVSYAASGATGTYHAVRQVAVHRTLFVSVHKSSAAAQYRRKPPKPHRKHHATGLAGVQSVARPKGNLPFTGLSLLATLVLSLVLVAAGLVLRRAERKRS